MILDMKRFQKFLSLKIYFENLKFRKEENILINKQISLVFFYTFPTQIKFLNL